MMHARRWTGLWLVPALLGCASATLPAERLVSAEAGIRGAVEVGAEGVPQAALHLKMARDQVAQAKSLAKDGEEERAALVLSRAGADAELALALAREAAAKAEANAVMAEVRTFAQRSP